MSRAGMIAAKMPIMSFLWLVEVTVTALALGQFTAQANDVIHGIMYRYDYPNGTYSWEAPVHSCRKPTHDLVLRNFSQMDYNGDPEATEDFWGGDTVGESEKKRYIIVKKLSEGAEASAYEAIDRETGKLVAIKKISNIFKNEDLFTATQILAEVKSLSITKSSPDFMTLSRMLLPRHPHSFDTIYIALDMLETTVPVGWSSHPGDILEPEAAETLRLRVFQFVRGVAFLHSAGLVHADLRFHNVMLDEKCNVRIIDLGDLMAGGEPKNKEIKHFPGTGTHYLFIRDLWMMGSTILTWLGGKEMYLDQSTSFHMKARLIVNALGFPSEEALSMYSKEIQHSFQQAREWFGERGPPPTLEERFPTVDPRLFEIIRRVMRLDRNVPSAMELLEDPYFEGLHKRLPVKQGPHSAVRKISSIWTECTSVKAARQMINQEVLLNLHGPHKKALEDQEM